MSSFSNHQLTCPHCHRVAEYSVAKSINPNGAVAYREQILDNSFQRLNCQHCGKEFQADYPFLYIDQKRKQFFGFYPQRWVTEWAVYQEEVLEAFHMGLGDKAPYIAKQMGKGMKVRTVFGYDALREKILLDEAGIDDLEMEVLKYMMITNNQGMDYDPDKELRFYKKADGHLLLELIDFEQLKTTGLTLPESTLKAIDLMEHPLAKSFEEDSFVDVSRLFSYSPRESLDDRLSLD